jgi:exodeoxyribonuclease VII large subunit
MPEHQESRKIFSLIEVTQSIQRTLAERYTSSFWVKAEMNKLNHYPHSGHCYPDLVEKQEGKVVAQLRSTLWKDDYHRINHQFLQVLKMPLKDGIKMLFCAKVTFDPAHGLALRIIDIDPVFSLGELEREKQETIDALKKKGLFNLNRSLALATVPQRIAVISVQTSKGYADFLNVIENNSHGFKFFQVLFPSLLQGERSIESILFQLERIRKVISHFDVVAIIRGGGGEVGLSSFNNFDLAQAICTFPLPVITGIGHATNETVAEMVAFKNAITPTDLANFLLDRFQQFYFPVRQAEQKLFSLVEQIFQKENEQVRQTGKYFRSVTHNMILKRQHLLDNCTKGIIHGTRHRIHRSREFHNALLLRLQQQSTLFTHKHVNDLNLVVRSLNKEMKLYLRSCMQSIEGVERTIRNLDPENVLKRGFSITRINGRAMKSSDETKLGDVLETELLKGKVVSEVKSLTEKKNE